MTETNFQFLDWRLDDGAGVLTLKRPPLNVINIAML
ncbi:MAG: enoyl-CoA hydratase, partial [Chloroflexi bacterium]|nr:enoyl-CoA hydratase [Chloroflexota bacterium]